MDQIFYLFIILLFIVGLFVYFKKAKLDQSQTEAIRDLERRLTDLMSNQLKEIRGNVDGASRSMMEQVRSFTKETVELKENLKELHKKVKDVSSFQEIFKSPKLRGEWGEASLKHILSQYFPPELYETQYLFSSGEQVDAVLKLPDNKLLPIDAKFSSDNFERMMEADEDKKEFYRREFIRDIKVQIDKIASKYILSSEGTLNIALMYIPAEAIYYEIMFNLRDENLAAYAWKKKVLLTSPNTICLALETILHWYRDTQLSKQTQQVLKRLNRINADARKLSDDFRKLGSHLSNALSAYEKSEKRLSLFSNRVENLLGEGEEPLKLNESNKDVSSH